MATTAKLQLTIRVSEKAAQRFAICHVFAESLRELATTLDELDFTTANDESPIALRDENGHVIGFAEID